MADATWYTALLATPFASSLIQGLRTSSHSRSKDLEHQGVVPARGAAFHTQAGVLRSFATDQIHRQSSQQREVLRRVVQPRTALVFLEHHIQHPVLGVLDAPMRADSPCQPFGIRLQAAD